MCWDLQPKGLRNQNKNYVKMEALKIQISTFFIYVFLDISFVIFNLDFPKEDEVGKL